MKIFLCSLIFPAMLAAMWHASTALAAQTIKTRPDLKAPAPRLPNGKPDFSGVWARPGTQDMTRTFTNRDGTSNKGERSLGTIGHPMSDKAKLTMYFERPDMGHVEFKWVLDDPKTHTRPISNDRVFLLTPDVEIMEYSCMEGNLTSRSKASSPVDRAEGFR